MGTKERINNFLLELDDISYIRKGSDNIRVYGLGDYINKIYGEIKSHRSISQIEIEFKTHQIFSNWILNKTGISIQDLFGLHIYWKKVCNKSSKELKNAWDYCYSLSLYFGCMNGKKVVLPKEIDMKMAYLLGIICGDGHLADPNKSYDKLTSYNSEIRITDQNKETFIFLGDIFFELFEYRPSIYTEISKSGKPFYRFVIKSKPLHRFFMSVCGIAIGDKRGKTKIPNLIASAPLDLQKWFISGFFDADGCAMIIKNKWPVIAITQYDERILKEISLISAKLGIQWKGPYSYRYKYNNCMIKINRKIEVQRFLNIIPSLNPIKIQQRETLWGKLKIIN